MLGSTTEVSLTGVVKMLESIQTYPLLWALVVLLLLIAIAVFVIAHKNKKAVGDSPELLLSARDVEQLRKSFAHLTAEKLQTVHGKELTYAVVTNMESQLDAEKEFDTFTKPQQNVYTLWYFSQIIAEEKGMCQFFREFGPPLTELIVPALMELEESRLAAIVDDAYRAFDGTNETASCDTKTVNALNEAFADAFDRVLFFDEMERYIFANTEAFVTK